MISSSGKKVVCICKPSTRTYFPWQSSRKYKIWIPETHIGFTIYKYGEKLFVCDESYFTIHYVYNEIKLPQINPFLYSGGNAEGGVCFSGELHAGNKYFDTEEEIKKWVVNHHYNAQGWNFGMDKLEKLTEKSKHKQIFKYLTNS